MATMLAPRNVEQFKIVWRSFVAIGGVRRMAAEFSDYMSVHGMPVSGSIEPAGPLQLPPKAFFSSKEKFRIIREVDLLAAAKYALWRHGFFNSSKREQDFALAKASKGDKITVALLNRSRL